MNWILVFRLLGYLSLIMSGSMILSLPWSFEALGEAPSFERASFFGMCKAIIFAFSLGCVLVMLGKDSRKDTLLRKEALAVVGFGWILCGILGGLPYWLTPTYRLAGVPMSLADSIFESVSGFSTTGASVLTQLEVPEGIISCEDEARAGKLAYIPRSVLFWRCFTHWLGGMGIIVLFVAILGQLGAGGKALMKREVPGPVSDSVRPRIRETATVMWSIYLGLSALMFAVLCLQGLNIYESLCHAFATLATGGFSTRNASVGSFQSPTLEYTIIIFMILAGTNFNLYYLLLKGSKRIGRTSLRGRITDVFSDPEYRVYLAIIAVATAAISFLLWKNAHYETIMDSIRHALFNVVAVMTTTGFGTENFVLWPLFTQGLLLLLMFVGGCSGSTGGGVKVIRFIVLFKVLQREGERSFRPNLVRPLRLAGRKIHDSVGQDVLVYFCFIAAIVAGSWLLIIGVEPNEQWANSGTSNKLMDCASAAISCLNNIGPGLGVCGPHSNYTAFSDTSKLIFSVLMLLGRLELFAIIVLLIPDFWKIQ